MPLLESAAAIRHWLQAANIEFDDSSHPLFCPLEPDRQTVKRKPIGQQVLLATIKKYAKQVGIQVDRPSGRGVCTHSLRKTAINNALKHDAKVEDVQAWAGHADIRTTQEYIEYQEKGAEDAARHCQIR